jgi:cardiolipin synthase
VDKTETMFLQSGEHCWSEMLIELRRAKRYIFLEFFIIEDGMMWRMVYDILKQKVKEGVEVRLMYDAFGCLPTLPFNFYKKVREYGILCRPFKQFVPFLTVSQNNRDHRKICVVDGRVAFTGGFNLADEYVNQINKHGHWLDAGIKLEGKAAFHFAVMFLQLWQLDREGLERIDYEHYRPDVAVSKTFLDDGFVMPFSDTPHDDENVGRNVYLDIINKAQRYVYIASPYLILDDEMQTALCFAAKRGVDVRVLVPKNADHWYAYAVATAFVANLIAEGVKIYKYEPGFVHSKNFVADDDVAVVGSINLDFRSLYLHYECAAWMYRSRAVKEVKKNYDKLLKISRLVTPEECTQINLFKRLVNAVLRIFAPLM